MNKPLNAKIAKISGMRNLWGLQYMNACKNILSKPLRHLWNVILLQYVACSSVLEVTYPCFLFVLFCDSFLCSISLLLLSDFPFVF